MKGIVGVLNLDEPHTIGPQENLECSLSGVMQGAGEGSVIVQ